jgi:hypothetical protein
MAERIVICALQQTQADASLQLDIRAYLWCCIWWQIVVRKQAGSMPDPLDTAVCVRTTEEEDACAPEVRARHAPLEILLLHI